LWTWIRGRGPSRQRMEIADLSALFIAMKLTHGEIVAVVTPEPTAETGLRTPYASRGRPVDGFHRPVYARFPESDQVQSGRQKAGTSRRLVRAPEGRNVQLWTRQSRKAGECGDLSRLSKAPTNRRTVISKRFAPSDPHGHILACRPSNWGRRHGVPPKARGRTLIRRASFRSGRAKRGRTALEQDSVAGLAGCLRCSIRRGPLRFSSAGRPCGTGPGVW
jgi:hypothetical protein